MYAIRSYYVDELLAERDKLNHDIQGILDAASDAWGIKVSTVEIKHVDLDESMIRAIARQAEAERSRRAKVIHASGELEASEQLVAAAGRLAEEDNAIMLRYLQTLTEIATDRHSTILFPLPLEFVITSYSIHYTKLYDGFDGCVDNLGKVGSVAETGYGDAA